MLRATTCSLYAAASAIPTFTFTSLTYWSNDQTPHKTCPKKNKILTTHSLPTYYFSSFFTFTPQTYSPYYLIPLNIKSPSPHRFKFSHKNNGKAKAGGYYKLLMVLYFIYI